MKKIKVAIDGHSSCGKSTMARSLARRAGYVYVDTGAMYRAVTLYALRRGFIKDGSIDEAALLSELDRIDVGFGPDGGVTLASEPVEKYIRGMEVSDNVFRVSSMPEVRERLVALQRELGRDGGVVMDGRDIGTVVFPDAELKVFVTASPEVRAERRFRELQAKGDREVTYEAVLKNVLDRDYADEHRAVSPLRKAPGAELIDNGSMTPEEQDALLWELFEKACRASR